MVRWPAAILLIAFLAGCGTDAPPLPWLTEEPAALRAAADTDRPVLVQLTASWCTYCKRMDADTYTAPAVRALLDRFVLLTVDVDLQPALARRYGTGMLPTTVVIDARGAVITAVAGFQDRRDFARFLESALTMAAARKPDNANPAAGT